MSQQEKTNTKQLEEGEQASSKSTEADTLEHPTSQRASPARPQPYTPAREPPSIFFAASPQQSPVLQEQGHGRGSPRPFNPPLPVSPSSQILRKDSKKKAR